MYMYVNTILRSPKVLTASASDEARLTLDHMHPKQDTTLAANSFAFSDVLATDKVTHFTRDQAASHTVTHTAAQDDMFPKQDNTCRHLLGASLAFSNRSATYTMLRFPRDQAASQTAAGLTHTTQSMFPKRTALSAMLRSVAFGSGPRV